MPRRLARPFRHHAQKVRYKRTNSLICDPSKPISYLSIEKGDRRHSLKPAMALRKAKAFYQLAGTCRPRGRRGRPRWRGRPMQAGYTVPAPSFSPRWRQSIPFWWWRRRRPMDASDRIDRKRRRVKPRSRQSWARRLANPRTLRILISLGQLATRIAWLIYLLIGFLRD